MKPQLRFPEFTDDWEEIELGKLGTFTKGANLSKADISETGTPFILYGELYTTYDEVAYDIKRKTEAKVDEKYYSKIGDVLIPTSGETAEEISKATCVMQDGVILAGDLNIFRNDTVDGRIISYIINYQIKRNIARIAQGKSIVHIQAKNLSKIKIKYPKNKAEQEKIIDCISSADDLISIFSKELKNLEELKKGVMQKIFSQEVRFKLADGTDYPDWEEKKLGEVADFINGVAHENAIVKNGSFIVVNSKFIATDGQIKKYTDNLLSPLKIGDIVLVMSDVPNGRAMSKCFLIQEDNKYTLNQRICCLRTKENQIFIMNQISRCSYFLKFDDGVTQTNLRKDDVLNCPVFLPCLEEQEKIADCLSAFDEAIKIKKEQIKTAKDLKKGLLQQMFT